jgi:hypothetical protein
MMRPLLLAACLVFSALLHAGEAAADASVRADWRKAELAAETKGALSALGYRFEEDGRVLGPGTDAALSSGELAEALSRLGARRPPREDDRSASEASAARMRAGVTDLAWLAGPGLSGNGLAVRHRAR